MTSVPETSPASGDVLFIPLNRLKKSPENVRKVPHPTADIAQLAASIAAKGLLQNLVVATMGDRRGVGVVEQIALGPHRPSGLTGFLDGHG